MDNTTLALLIPLCLGGIFFILGVGLLLFGLQNQKKAKAAESWPTVNGTIVSARLDEVRHTDRRQGRTYTRVSYNPMVEYSYEVAGNTHKGSRIFPGSTMSYDQGTARNIINRYQPNTTVNVHYDPADPKTSVLETKSKGGSLFIIMGIVFIVLGGIAGCVGVVLVFAAQA